MSHSRRRPAELLEDLIAEILLRLPPDEPEFIFRATLICKTWRRILTDPGFFRRYREFHRTAPPLLGFVPSMHGGSNPRFIPTTAFRPGDSDVVSCIALHCHQGRVLLYGNGSRGGFELLVWHPMTGEKHRLPMPNIQWEQGVFNAAALCATADCNHLGCHGCPFLVAFVGEGYDGDTHACLYSSETGAWSTPTSLQTHYDIMLLCPPFLAGDALYILCHSAPNYVILRYNFRGDGSLSAIDPPQGPPGMYERNVILMPAEDGKLGFAGLDHFTLYLWTRETAIDGVPSWVQRGVIELHNPLLPSYGSSTTSLIGFAQGCYSDIIFVGSESGTFIVDLKSMRTGKVYKRSAQYGDIPYMNFCTPDRANGGLPSSATTQ